MADDDDSMKPDAVEVAIAQAAQRTPKVQMIRDRLQKLADDDEKGMQVLVSAIRTLLHEG